MTSLRVSHRSGPVAAGERIPAPLSACWLVAGNGKAFVDFQNDVSADDIGLAARENFRSVEHLKRYTTLGMAPDQGKTSNVNALAIMASLTGRTVPETGHTRYRFPFTPVALGAMASRNIGDLYRPLRRLPAHDRHLQAGAMLEDYGGWARAACYIQDGEIRADGKRFSSDKTFKSPATVVDLPEPVVPTTAL
jgi:sarcosine oxidase, subunit alpha